MAAGITYTPIATTTLGSATSTVTFSSISGSYTDLVLVCSTKLDGSGGDARLDIRVNSDSGSNYSNTIMYGTGSSAVSARNSSQTESQVGRQTSSNWSNSIIHINNYSNITTNKTILGRGNNPDALVLAAVSLWRSTAAISSITVYPQAGTANNFVSGSTFSLYGITAA